MAKVLRSIRLSPEADEVLRVMANRQERSVSQLIELAVRDCYMAGKVLPAPSDVPHVGPSGPIRKPVPRIQRGSPSPSLLRFSGK